MGDEIHLVVRCSYDLIVTPEIGEDTVQKHIEVLEEKGSVWWGMRTTPRLEMMEQIKGQIEEGKQTFAFIYESKTPPELSQTGHRWFIAELSDIISGQPTDDEFIPEHYRYGDVCSAFLRLMSIRSFPYTKETFPILRGRSSLWYVQLRGKPSPENLRQHSDPSKLVVNLPGSTLDLDTPIEEVEAPREELDQDKIIHLQEQVIRLQEQIIELESENKELAGYKRRFEQIRSLDFLFSEEKLFEDWLVKNMHKVIPRLRVLDRQVRITWEDGQFRQLDLFCMDQDTKDLVIVEVKTRKHRFKTAFDQYLKYTSWARRNLNRINAHYQDQGLCATEGLGFLIITDYVTDEMKAICEDNGIGLIRIIGGIGPEIVTPLR